MATCGHCHKPITGNATDHVRICRLPPTAERVEATARSLERIADALVGKAPERFNATLKLTLTAEHLDLMETAFAIAHLLDMNLPGVELEQFAWDDTKGQP